ncbi:bile acid:sodium symporter family protein [Pedosphaera parvula]|uniref:Bile acid:sodium symporter n=1 Tax=Pedosphaera parvula (strain Ellin514) TaxID=320771 RepID=B9XG50_PEDPL|nr:bile acid transporter [Pedosphaera parvula]EEF61212.1 Bile acid:sodium symporter [Pedosphaera parvula Ellin514]
MTFNTTNTIRLLTMASLGGLLFAVGLRLNWKLVVHSMKGSRLGWILLINFLLVPALTLAVTFGLRIPTNIAVGMLLLAAAPFAPVVPIFVRMAKGNMALAGTLTALFPFFSAFLTPLVCEWSLRPWLGAASLKFNILTILIVLLSTITLPLTAGVVFSHYFPAMGRKLLRPLEIISEATGAVSLTFVTVVEFETILSTGWKPLLAMVLVSELSLLVGYNSSGPSIEARRVVALGTSNRNIALALLIAIQSFPNTSIVAAVVANGLVLIFLGLLHVGFWRFCTSTGHRA